MVIGTLLMLHGFAFWVVFDVLAPNVTQIPTFPAIAIGILEIMAIGKVLELFQLVPKMSNRDY